MITRAKFYILWHTILKKISLLLLILLVGCAKEDSTERAQIRWFVGLDINSSFTQIELLNDIVAEYNASQSAVELSVEVAAIDGAYDMFAAQIATNMGPDIVGPIPWGTAMGFPDQWLALDDLIDEAGFETAVYPPPLLDFYQFNGQQISLPFAIYPSAIYYNPTLFDELGLAHPPQVYGEPYVLNGRLLPWNWATVAELAQLLTLDSQLRNSTHPDFDRTHMVQVGFVPQEQSAAEFATFFGPAQLYAEAASGFIATIPRHWQEAWRWWYEGMWGERPYIAHDTVANSYEFGSGNVFNSGRAAMALSQSSYTCCLTDLRDNGGEFQLAVLPTDENGVVNGRLSELSFYIWQGTQHSPEAFDALSYIVTHGGNTLWSAFDAIPAIPSEMQTFFEGKTAVYPTVTPASWDILRQNLAYYDRPSADQYLPNRNEAANRLLIFKDRLISTDNLDFDHEFETLQEDLTAIYNR